jgi:hypothetical protein
MNNLRLPSFSLLRFSDLVRDTESLERSITLPYQVTLIGFYFACPVERPTSTFNFPVSALTGPSQHLSRLGGSVGETAGNDPSVPTQRLIGGLSWGICILSPDAEPWVP